MLSFLVAIVLGTIPVDENVPVHSQNAERHF